MSYKDRVDLSMTKDGDLEVEQTRWGGDLKLAEGLECVEQDVNVLIKSEADLEELKGKINNIKTGEIGVQQIRQALVDSGAVKPGDLDIFPYPHSANTIVFLISVNISGQEIKVPIKVEI